MNTIIRYGITATVEGDLEEIIAAAVPPAPALEDVLATLRNLAFVVEVHPALADNATAQRCVTEAKAFLAQLGA